MLCVWSLLGLGLVLVYSASFVLASENFGDGYFFFKRQLIFVALSLLALLFTTNIDYYWLKKGFWPLFILEMLLLLMTLVPGIGHRAGGASRWINLPFNFHLEPSELAKLFAPVAFSFLLVDKKTRGISFWIKALSITVLPVVLLLKQPDFGSAVIIFLVGLSLLFCFGLPWGYLAGLFAMAGPVFYFFVMMVDYRRARVLAFLNPWSDPTAGGFQVIQSMVSFYSGGLWGVGIGQGQGKLFFLPEAHTDFILAVLGEETGFVGVVLVLILFSWLVLRGFQIAMQCDEPFGKRLALGFSVLIAFSALINIGVVTGLLPTKGLAMPFLSYGGSHLIATSIACGMLISIRRGSRLV